MRKLANFLAFGGAVLVLFEGTSQLTTTLLLCACVLYYEAEG